MTSDRPVEVGRTVKGEPFLVDARDLQGLNIVAGTKYTGKILLVRSILSSDLGF